jgi:hypothetical protein
LGIGLQECLAFTNKVLATAAIVRRLSYILT